MLRFTSAEKLDDTYKYVSEWSSKWVMVVIMVVMIAENELNRVTVAYS